MIVTENNGRIWYCFNTDLSAWDKGDVGYVGSDGKMEISDAKNSFDADKLNRLTSDGNVQGYKSTVIAKTNNASYTACLTVKTEEEILDQSKSTINQPISQILDKLTKFKNGESFSAQVNIPFESGTTRFLLLDNFTEEKMIPLIDAMKANPNINLTIRGNSGYVDDGSNDYQIDNGIGTVNQLMQLRADKVKSIFTKNGINTNRINATTGTSSNDAYVDMQFELPNVNNESR